MRVSMGFKWLICQTVHYGKHEHCAIIVINLIVNYDFYYKHVTNYSLLIMAV